MESVGERLKRARETAGLSQDDLAERSGVSQSSIARFEKGPGGGGTADPGIIAMSKLATALGIPLIEFMPPDQDEEATLHARQLSIEERVAILENDRNAMRKQLAVALNAAREALKVYHRLKDELAHRRTRESAS